jgi:hypothetical protein
MYKYFMTLSFFSFYDLDEVQARGGFQYHCYNGTRDRIEDIF